MESTSLSAYADMAALAPLELGSASAGNYTSLRYDPVLVQRQSDGSRISVRGGLYQLDTPLVQSERLPSNAISILGGGRFKSHTDK